MADGDGRQRWTPREFNEYVLKIVNDDDARPSPHLENLNIQPEDCDAGFTRTVVKDNDGLSTRATWRIGYMYGVEFTRTKIQLAPLALHMLETVKQLVERAHQNREDVLLIPRDVDAEESFCTIARPGDLREEVQLTFDFFGGSLFLPIDEAIALLLSMLDLVL